MNPFQTTSSLINCSIYRSWNKNLNFLSVQKPPHEHHDEQRLERKLFLWKGLPLISPGVSGRSLPGQCPADASRPSADLERASLTEWRSLPAKCSPRMHHHPEPAGGSPSGPGPPEGSAHRPAEERQERLQWINHITWTIWTKNYLFC